jgi:hypothetical protein
VVATLYAGFNTDRIGSLACELTTLSVTGEPMPIAAGRYSHLSLESVIGTGLYTALAQAVSLAASIADPSTDFNISFSATTRLYTTANAANTVTLDFTSTAGQRLAKALGFTSSNPKAISGSGYACVVQAADGVLTSNVLPYYLVPLARDEPAKYQPPYEPTGLVKQAFTTNGTGVSVEPLSMAEMIDLQSWFLPKANVFEDYAAAAQPFTIQHLIKHARAHEPVLFDFVSTGDLVCKLGPSSAQFGKDMRNVAFESGDYQGLWHCVFNGIQLLGTL